MVTEKSPVFFLSSVLGLFPSKQHKKLSRSVGIVFIILIVIYYCEELKWIISKSDESNTSRLLYVSYVTLNILLIVVCYINSIIHYKLCSSFTNNIAFVDHLSKNLELSFNYNVSNSNEYKKILYIFLFTVSFAILHQLGLTEHNFPSVNIIEIACIPMIWLQVYQIDILLNQLAMRFNYIKCILETNIKKSIEAYWIHWCSIGPKDITTLNRIHFFTYISFKEVCSFYDIQLLVIIPRVIVSNVLPVHYNVVAALMSDKDETPHKWSQIFTLSMIVLSIGPIIHLVRCASNTINKATQIIDTIHKLLDLELPQELEDELYLFSQQLLHRPLKFTVKESFTIKPSLVASMLELIITYVIILLQFQDSLKTISPAQFLVSPKN
ncbi:putative gustatory receptor 28b isoform X2 [Adelges cooleyi]|uniref:putative gustatory receptor 28b isoform X2 n=1 Tax=Adelges cooleyi TaxID=133065 RepID=UPI00217F924A|nr:putative gustatory receptor 28b isoform X2 [Adelges cooleyi]